MCTSIFTVTKNNKHLLARTMDYSFPLDFNVVYLPRDHEWNSAADKVAHTSKYGVLGAGRSLGSSYFLADGVNEHGLAIAELYLPQKAVYQKTTNDKKINLAPHEFIMWALGQFKSIDELKKKLTKVNLMDVPAPMIDTITPLHWILTDTTGACMVIEPTQKMLHLKENPVGVMTNTPLLEWHIENLNNYLNVRPKQYEPQKYGDYTAKAFSQGTGTMGLPGGYTPPERFVRAAFFKENIAQANSEIEGVTNATKILSTVQIPKGIVITLEDKEDYSQYTGIMCNESQTYYYRDYHNSRLIKVQLNEELLDRKSPKIFVVNKIQDLEELNKSNAHSINPTLDFNKKIETEKSLLDKSSQEVSLILKSLIDGHTADDKQQITDQLSDELKQVLKKLTN